jgi:hypothetical protein
MRYRIEVATANLTNILVACAMIAAIIAVPCLSFSAFRRWKSHSQPAMAFWRRGLGLISLLALLLSWFGMTVPLFLALFAKREMSDYWLPLELSLILVAVASALALKGTARILSLLAGLLLVGLFFSNVNF